MATFPRNNRKAKLPTTTTEHEETGTERAFAEGTGGGGLALEAADPAVVNGSGVSVPGQHYDNGDSGRTREQLAKLLPTSHITHVGEAYCPNPQNDELPLGYETLVRAIQRHPELRTVEKTDVIKEVHYEEQTVLVPKTRFITDKIKHIDQIIVVRRVPKTRIKTVYRVVQEEVEVTEMVDVVDYIDVPRIEEVPRYFTENVEEKISVPVLRDVRVTSTVEVPTENYCEAPVADFITPTPFKLIEGRTKPTPFNLIEGRSASDNDDDSKAVQA